MFGYVLKRVARGWTSFIALFLGITIATTLFSGTMMGAEKVGYEMLDVATTLVPVDIVVADLLRDLSAVDISRMENNISSTEQVVYTEQLIRWNTLTNLEGLPKKFNETTDFIIVALEEDSHLWHDVFGDDFEGVEIGHVYVESDSLHASDVEIGSNITLYCYSHNPNAPPGYKTFYFNFTVAGLIEIDRGSYMKATAQYPFFIRSMLYGTGRELRKPPHDLLFTSKETLYKMFERVYEHNRLPNKQITVEVLVDLERNKLVNPWDIGKSSQRVKLVSEIIDNKLQTLSESAQGDHAQSWQNFLKDILETVKSITNNLKIGFVLIALPVFFTAWYMGVTVSEVSLSSRRREVGLLITKGYTRRQIFVMFLVEAVLIGLLSGLIALTISTFFTPLPGFRSNLVRGPSLLSTSTILFTLLFSTAISLLSVFMTAWNVSRMNVIDALKEYREAEESILPSRTEPVIALTLGLYKLLMFFFGISVESFRPVGGGLLVFILYSTWWGVDYILGFLGPILFFWGFTKLFIQGSFRVQDAVGALSSRFIGDLSKIATLSARRTLRRTATITFLIALIFGYSITVIGGLATTEDRMIRIARSNVGADASVWLFNEEGAHELAEKIGALDGVLSTAVEQWFYVESAFLSIQLRAIEPEAWGETAFLEEEWFTGESRETLQFLAGSDLGIILDRGLAESSGLEIGDTVTFKIRWQLYETLTIVGLIGPGLEGGQYTPLPSYVNEGFLERHSAFLDIIKSRILTRLEPRTDAATFADNVEEMSENIEVVITAAEQLEVAKSNIFLKGPRQVQELGVPFATLVSSVGVALVVSTTLRERQKELTLMTIRGFSFKQLFEILMVENVSIIVFAIILGSLVGYVSIMGEVAISNTTSQLILSRVIFPPSSVLFIIFIALAVMLSAIIPILVASIRTSKKLSWKIIE